MVGLPTQESRELILRTLLAKEKVAENIDFKELATMTEGYSGSDLKVCALLRNKVHIVADN
jgi:ATP-dependent 26S proteasome regulatory subunit